jgi:Fur family transcriptional regulator, ferric uptake regulator
MPPTRRTGNRIPEAQKLIREAGERLTSPRSAVLATLLASGEALSHHDIEERLRDLLSVDRVTVYRVLDWLTGTGLAHRIAGDDRTWRFNASRGRHAGRHAHFTCSGCGKTVCLDEIPAELALKMPRGFVSREFELNVRGLCSRCH